MSDLAAGVHAALTVVGFLAVLAAVGLVVAAGAAVAITVWNGPAARAGMRVRAWRFLHRLRS